MALRLDKDRPTRSQTAERVVEAAGDPDQLCWNRAVEVRATEARGALERAILVEDDAFAGERDPGQEIRQAGRGAAVFCKVHHGVSPQLRRSDGRGRADAGEPHRRTAGHAWPPRTPRNARARSEDSRVGKTCVRT